VNVNSGQILLVVFAIAVKMVCSPFCEWVNLLCNHQMSAMEVMNPHSCRCVQCMLLDHLQWLISSWCYVRLSMKQTSFQVSSFGESTEAVFKTLEKEFHELER